MNTLPNAPASLPWYRQFWPWFIFSLPAAVVVAGIVTVIIANRHADDLVVRDYYKTGLAINQQLEKRERAEALGMSIRFEVDGSRVLATLTGPGDPQSLVLRLSHPLESDQDFDVVLHRAPRGAYTAILERAVAPRWHWVVETSNDSQWRLDGVLNPSDFLSAESS